MARTSLNIDKFNWGDDACDALREMVDKHWSDSHMARELSAQFGGRVSRNAVIGKRHRLGLNTGKTVTVARRKPGASIPKTKCSDGPRLTMRKLAQNQEIKLQTALPFECKPVTFMEREGCSWPVDVDGVELYCNNATLTRLPYCAHHVVASQRRNEPKAESPNMRRFTSTGQFR